MPIRAVGVVLIILLVHVGANAQPLTTQPAITSARTDATLTNLTIYSTADPATFDPRQIPFHIPGCGLVREVRRISLSAGLNNVDFVDVPAGIDPTTLAIKSLGAPDAVHALEQSFLNDVTVPEKLLQRYVGQNVLINRRSSIDDKAHPEETKEGKLLAFDAGHFLLETRNRQMPIEMIPRTADIMEIKLFNLAGLVTRPTLNWKLQTEQTAAHDMQISYQTEGLTWRADYKLVMNKAETEAEIGGWISIVNQSGTAYPNAKIKLVAGDVQRLTKPVGRGDTFLSEPAPRGVLPPVENANGERHAYNLERATTVPNNSTKQVEFFPTRSNVAVAKSLVLNAAPDETRNWTRTDPATERSLGTRSSKRVDVFVHLKNTAAIGLGMPLPAGRVRAYSLDEVEANEDLLSEDTVDATGRDEDFIARIGSIADLVGERRQMEFVVDPDGRGITETFEITVRNARKEAAHVTVRETMYRWSNWTVLKKSDEITRQDARTVEFLAEVPPTGEKKISYTVKYAW